MYRYEGKTWEKSKVISGETSLNLLAEERVCGLHITNTVAIEPSERFELTGISLSFGVDGLDVKVGSCQSSAFLTILYFPEKLEAQYSK